MTSGPYSQDTKHAVARAHAALDALGQVLTSPRVLWDDDADVQTAAAALHRALQAATPSEETEPGAG